MRIRRTVTAVSIAALLALAACGDDDDDSPSVTPPDGATTEQPSDATPTTGGGPAEGDDQASPGPGRCQDLQEAPDGVYEVGDAGELVVQRDGERLTLVETRPAPGWRASEDDADDDDEVEVKFRNDGREIEFEAEIDDGRLEIDVCEHD